MFIAWSISIVTVKNKDWWYENVQREEILFIKTTRDIVNFPLVEKVYKFGGLK